jgi:hypothetical protein
MNFTLESMIAPAGTIPEVDKALIYVAIAIAVIVFILPLIKK